MPSQLDSQTVLVTGGLGYIGAHACVVLQELGKRVVIADNLCNSSPKALDRIAAISGQRPEFAAVDIRDEQGLSEVFSRFRPDSVMHFAGLKAVGESVEKPDLYHDNNVNGTRSLLRVMESFSVFTLVFSSSATVYGQPQFCPITESHPLAPINPYGQNKLDIENLLRERKMSNNLWRIALLRYFNPVGAHPSGLIGEDPNGVPNNLMPYIAQVAVGRQTCLRIFGNDYDTVDGTGMRDYVHVMDLVNGHIDALAYISSEQEPLVVNLGTGKSVSVMQMVHAFEQASGQEIPYKIVPRRAGDSAANWADAGLARQLLGWQSELDLYAMCRDSWNWQCSNPDGYDTILQAVS